MEDVFPKVPVLEQNGSFLQIHFHVFLSSIEKNVVSEGIGMVKCIFMPSFLKTFNANYYSWNLAAFLGLEGSSDFSHLGKILGKAHKPVSMRCDPLGKLSRQQLGAATPLSCASAFAGVHP